MNARTHIAITLSMLVSLALFPCSSKAHTPFDKLYFIGISHPIPINIPTPDGLQSDSLIYRYVEFERLPSTKERLKLQQQGITFINYIRDRIYLISYPADLSITSASYPKISNILKPLPSVAKEINPLSSESTGYTEWLIQLYPGQLEGNPRILKIIEKEGWEIRKIEPELNAIIVSSNSQKIKSLLSYPFVSRLEPIIPYKTENWNTTAFHATELQLDLPEGIATLNGNNIHIAIGDDGFIEPHIDLIERLYNTANIKTDGQGQHGDLIAGIIGGNGNGNPLNKGVAPASILHILNDFDAVKTAKLLYQDKNITSTCTAISDGCNRGYSTLANLADRQIWEIPQLMHIFSAGNAGDEDCLYGAGVGWGTITGGVKMAKNALTVGYLNANAESPTAGSKGPASDGRIKPDLVAYGHQITSIAPTNSYNVISGSSAAAAVVTGIWAQLTDGYRKLKGNVHPPSSLLKAVLLNTAEDLGNPGPDYTYGYGMPNATRAWENLQSNQYIYDTIDHNEIKTFSIPVSADVSMARFLLYWHDQEASPAATTTLVNNLDIVILSPNGDSIHPLVLNPAPNSNTLNHPATPAVDTLNNVEQITIPFPESGNYTVILKGTKVPLGPQPCLLTWCLKNNETKLKFPLGGEKFAPNETIPIHWESPTTLSPYIKLEYSLDNGLNWNLISFTNADSKKFLWKPDFQLEENIIIKIQDGFGITTTSQSFSVLPLPQKPEIIKVCGNSITLTWPAVENAVAYQLFQLQGSTMDSIQLVTDTLVDIPINNMFQQCWFAIAALFEGGTIGRRSPAVTAGLTPVNCELNNDLAIWKVQVPGGNALADCYSSGISVSALLTNEGIAPQTTFKLCFSINKQTPICESAQVFVPPGASFLYTFDSTLHLASGIHQLSAWPSLNKDEASYNDTAETIITVHPSKTYKLPYYQNFDDFPTSNPFDDCQSDYTLPGHWINNKNNEGDDTDWRAWSGPTPTQLTGPSYDQNTRSERGKYLYLESSRGCYEQNAHLLSPCLNLSNTKTPFLSFWYNLFGQDIGALHVDIFDGKIWTPNIIPPLIGNCGEDWQKAEIDLTSFTNQTIIIRFRGITGNGYLSDIAIDNIAIYDASSAPSAAFISDVNVACPGQAVQFFDNSINNPEAWWWEVSPNTIQFLNHTEASSPNPIVSFLQPGDYSIKFYVKNTFGTSFILKEDYIHVSSGLIPPYTENFENEDHLYADWKIINDDTAIGWESIKVPGRNGSASNAVYVNNHHYAEINQADILQSPIINLENLKKPTLRFDVAYAAYGNDFEDELIVSLSSDCGHTFQEILFQKKGKELSTAAPETKCWYPSSKEHWQNIEIDLSPFKDKSVSIRFTNICGYGNNMFLDNFWIGEKMDFPRADIRLDKKDSIFCLNTPVVCQLNSNTTESDTIQWDFGLYAYPGHAHGPGPHEIIYSKPGPKKIKVFIKNTNGFDDAEKEIQLYNTPTANFSYHQIGKQTRFVNLSEYAVQWWWDFGDKQTEKSKNPIHQYPNSGQYKVMLKSSSLCGISFASQVISIPPFEQSDENLLVWSVHPNPASSHFNTTIYVPEGEILNLSIFDVIGKKVFSKVLNIQQTGWASFDTSVSSLPAGPYIIRLSSPSYFQTKKLIIER